MRITYIDESGTHDDEPYFVIAGVIVHGDKKLAQVEDYLEFLVEKHIPEQDRIGFIFHATDIWNGNRYFKDKNEWPWERRESLFREIIETIPKFKLPVCVGFYDRVRAVPFVKPMSVQELDKFAHTMSLMGMAIQLEGFLRKHWPDECTILVHEQRAHMTQILKDAILTLRITDKLDENFRKALPEENVPLRHIRDTPHFAAKEDCRLLQLSDHCAYLLRGTMSGNKKHWPYHDIIAPQMISYPEHLTFHHDRAMKAANPFSVLVPWE